jgi:hypothetical protein
MSHNTHTKINLLNTKTIMWGIKNILEETDIALNKRSYTFIIKNMIGNKLHKACT